MAWQKKGLRKLKKINVILDTCDRLLQTDRAKGEQSGYRAQPTLEGGIYYGTRAPHGTLFFPVGHGLEGQSRYNWVPQPDGSTFGYLTDDARADIEEEKEAALGA